MLNTLQTGLFDGRNDPDDPDVLAGVLQSEVFQPNLRLSSHPDRYTM